ncbi:hypothetical protein HY025_01515 [Candidatus Daviesbacteria bacterium]|nr:hypothetical protein [Candidatus Daviesbacteria bacterium]
MKILKRLLPVLISLAVLLYVIYFTEPPSSWVEASTFQILSFFIPLLCFLTFLANIFIGYLPKSFILGLGGMLLIVLKSINALNIFLTAAVVLLTLVSFRFYQSSRLIREPRIPSLRLSKSFDRSKLKHLGARR